MGCDGDQDDKSERQGQHVSAKSDSCFFRPQKRQSLQYPSNPLLILTRTTKKPTVSASRAVEKERRASKLSGCDKNEDFFEEKIHATILTLLQTSPAIKKIIEKISESYLKASF